MPRLGITDFKDMQVTENSFQSNLKKVDFIPEANLHIKYMTFTHDVQIKLVVQK